MINVLWLCNIVLPDFCEEFMIKKQNTGGWMTGMLHSLEEENEVDVSLCFPIYNPNRLKSGICKGHRYYTFFRDSIDTCSINMIKSFEQILDESCPDIIHIWGSEFAHTTAMLRACTNKGIIDRAVIHIQGLISICAKHYFADVPSEYLMLNSEKELNLKEKKIVREKRGKCEIESIKMVRHVIGRTDWDEACVKAINPQIDYHFCDEILRNVFYKNAGTWDSNVCQKHSIFIGQVYYPIKGFHYLLQALPIIVRRYPDTHVYVAGQNFLDIESKDSYAIYIEDLIKELQLDKAITFLGVLDENQMVQQYVSANVFVLASAVENSPNSLNEAMIIGVPCVASYVGGVGNRMHMGEDGFLYPHDEPDLLAHYICKIFENEDGLCEKFSNNSVRKMLEFVDPKKNAERNIVIYKKILEG